VQELYLPLPFYESLPFCVWYPHSLWQQWRTQELEGGYSKNFIE
jgi:hypothetical protein